MDMLERRIRDAVATLLSRGARALERTAGELEQAASELRREQDRRDEAERVWAETRPEPDTMIRSAPLRAVPDTPTDAASPPADRQVPPVRPPRTPKRPRPGAVDAAIVTGAQPPDLRVDSHPERLREMAAGTVSEIRAKLGELSVDELRTLREIETENRNRVTLLTAIDRTLDDEQ